MNFGERLMDFRKALRMSQKKLSAKTGINQPRISRIESNKVAAHINELTKFAQAFEITESELLDANTRITLQITKQKGLDLFFLLTKIEAYLENVALNQWQRFVSEDGIIEIDNDALLQEAVDYVCQYDVKSILHSLDAIFASKEAIAAIGRMFDDMTLMVTEFAEDAAEWNRARSQGIPGILRYHGLSVGDFV